MPDQTHHNAMSDLRPPPPMVPKKNRTPGIIFVIVLHILLVYALASGLANSTIELLRGDLEATVVAEVAEDDGPPPPPPPDFEPPPPTVPPPDITIDLAPQQQAQQQTIQTVVERPAPPPPVVAAAPPPPPPITPPRAGPRNIVDPNTDYPPISVRLQEEGRVQLAVVVGADGSCKDAQVVSSSGKTRLDEASVTLCKRKFKWTPATQGGTPIEAKVNMNVTWQLR